MEELKKAELKKLLDVRPNLIQEYLQEILA